MRACGYPRLRPLRSAVKGLGEGERREKRERERKECGEGGKKKNKVAKTGKVAATVAFSLKMVPPPFSDV
jgi:hypothetical protein